MIMRARASSVIVCKPGREKQIYYQGLEIGFIKDRGPWDGSSKLGCLFWVVRAAQE